jgi:hypothetical protein
MELIDRLVEDDFASSTGCEWGDKAADENRAWTSVLASDGGVLGAVTLSKASPAQSLFARSCYSGGNPRSCYPRSDDDDALASLYLLRISLLDQRWLAEARGGVVLFDCLTDESQRRGAAGPRCWLWLDGLAQERGTAGIMVVSMVGMVRAFTSV